MVSGIPTSTPATGPRILVVDDEVDILDSLESLFLASIPGCVIFKAQSGPEGLAALRENRVDIIISDYRMPGMDGIEFLLQSQEYCPDANRVILTAFPKLEIALRAINDVTVDKFLTKPIHVKDLLQTVETLLRRRKAEGRHAPPRLA